MENVSIVSFNLVVLSIHMHQKQNSKHGGELTAQEALSLRGGEGRKPVSNYTRRYVITNYDTCYEEDELCALRLSLNLQSLLK